MTDKEKPKGMEELIEKIQKEWRIRHLENPSITSLSGRYILERKKGTHGERREDQLESKKMDSVIQKGRRMLCEGGEKWEKRGKDPGLCCIIDVFVLFVYSTFYSYLMFFF